MLEKIIKKFEEFPVAAKTIGWGIVGYVLFSPGIMLINDQFHKHQSVEENLAMRNNPLLSITETFSYNFLLWTLTFTGLTAITGGIFSYISYKSRESLKAS